MLEKKFTDFSDLASKKYDDANDTISRLAKNDSDHQELRRKEANSKETK
jgi:hypothetical protein